VSLGRSTPPVDVATADVNGDGKADLISEDAAGAIALLAGDGAGGFTALPSVALPQRAIVVNAGDFNADGVTDLVALRPVSASSSNFLLAVVRGLGGGAFGPETTYTFGSPTDRIVVADLNGDALPDIAGINGTATIAVFLNRLDAPGAFQAPSTVSASTNAASLVATDFDGDGKVDLMAGSLTATGISFLRGDGAGSFRSSVTLTSLPGPSQLRIADLNRDGKPDLVCRTRMLSPVQVRSLINNGAGGLTLVSSVTVAVDAGALSTIDANRDGVTDVLATSTSTSFPPRIGVEVLVGNISGALSLQNGIVPGDVPCVAAVADFDGDGFDDFASVGSTVLPSPQPSVGGIDVYRSNGDGTFGAVSGRNVSAAPARIDVADFNRDGNLDVVSGGRTSTGGSISVVLGSASGVLSAPVNRTFSDAVGEVRSADFNRDGAPDLAYLSGSAGGGVVRVMLGNGNGTFGNPVAYPTATDGQTSLTVDDASGDGIPDVVITHFSRNFVSVLLGRPDGTLAPETQIALGGNATSSFVGDIDLDGKADLLLTYGSNSWLARGLGGGRFESPARPIQLYGSSYCLEDFNRDGRLDLLSLSALTFGGDVYARMLIGAPDNTFVPGPATKLLPETEEATAADFDGDGDLDVVVTYHYGRLISVLLNDGNGGFGPAVNVRVPYGAGYPTTGDMNRDGRTDLVMGLYVGPSVTQAGWVGVLTNFTKPEVSAALSPASDTGLSTADQITNDPTPSVNVRANQAGTIELDYTGDGVADLIQAVVGPGTVTVTLPALADGAHDIATRFVPTRGAAVTAATISIVVDTVSPNVTLSDFQFESSQRLRFSFNEAINPSSAIVSLVDRSTGARIDADAFSTTYDAASKTLVIRPASGSSFPDGDYRVTLASGVQDIAGNALAADVSLDFFVLAGDATRDRIVNFDDLLVLAANYNQVGRTFSQGDFTYDGTVNFDDLLVLASRYNQGLTSALAGRAILPPPVGGPQKDEPEPDRGDADDVLV
jgi:hypothetical protein